MSEEKDERIDAKNFVSKDKMENDQIKNRVCGLSIDPAFYWD